MQFLIQRTNPAYSPDEQALKSLVSTCQFKMVILPPPFTRRMAEHPHPQLLLVGTENLLAGLGPTLNMAVAVY